MGGCFSTVICICKLGGSGNLPTNAIDFDYCVSDGVSLKCWPWFWTGKQTSFPFHFICLDLVQLILFSPADSINPIKKLICKVNCKVIIMSLHVPSGVLCNFILVFPLHFACMIHRLQETKKTKMMSVSVRECFTFLISLPVSSVPMLAFFIDCERVGYIKVL